MYSLWSLKCIYTFYNLQHTIYLGEDPFVWLNIYSTLINIYCSVIDQKVTSRLQRPVSIDFFVPVQSSSSIVFIQSWSPVNPTSPCHLSFTLPQGEGTGWWPDGSWRPSSILTEASSPPPTSELNAWTHLHPVTPLLSSSTQSENPSPSARQCCMTEQTQSCTKINPPSLVDSSRFCKKSLGCALSSLLAKHKSGQRFFFSITKSQCLALDLILYWLTIRK